MPSERGRHALLGILENAEAARDFVASMTFEAFETDRKTVYAVTRCLEIISEASRRVDAETKLRHSHIPWRQIANAGNVYRHDYENVLPSHLWLAVQERLGELVSLCTTELQRPDEPSPPR